MYEYLYKRIWLSDFNNQKTNPKFQINSNDQNSDRIGETGYNVGFLRNDKSNNFVTWNLRFICHLFIGIWNFKNNLVRFMIR